MSLSGNWLLFKTRHSRLKQQVAAGFRHPGRRTDELAADKFAAPERVQITELPNGRLVTLVTQEAASKHIILLHGGAYALRATESHREWMELLSADTGANVTAIDFPLTPEYTARDTVSFTVKAYQKLRDQFPLDDYYLLGDSAGGGLALVLLQTLRDQKLPMPTGTLLVSPWSDLAMTAPSFEAGADADPELSLPVLREVAKKYAGKLALTDPLVSPINANLDHLGKIGLFYGTKEVLLPEHHALAQKLVAADGTDVDIHEFKNMMHDYLLWPNLPESHRTFTYLQDMMN